MADTGLKSPALSSTGTWFTPNNAFSSNDAYSSSNGLNSLQAWKNFTFGIPAGATIDGIIVKVEGNYPFVQGTSTGIELSWNDGTNYTTSGKTVIFADVDSIQTAGSTTDKWGKTDWTDAHFSNANFRIRLKENTDPLFDAVNVDHVQVQIFYTVPATGPKDQPTRIAINRAGAAITVRSR